ncbi:uncharacterized protein LOC118191883 isoform X2 [Stegodyphus dumicola]|nr:uncharacterized protein LOC118191883 isoform X2 [Stegodyphus dumicola]
MSFQSTLSSSSASASFHSQLSEQSESKEELISSLLSKVRSHNKVEASKILLAMSNSVENCVAMRQCGCLPLLIQLLHNPDENSNTYHMVHAKRVNFEIRERASQVLHNIVFSQPDDKKGRREARVLRLLEQIRDYCDMLRSLDAVIDDNRNARCVDQHLGPSVAALMKLSFDEEHRYAMCQLGGLQAIAELLQIDHEVHGCTNDQYCITIRRYSGMALTNLTFGDGANKALLCSMRPFMEALVAQLYSPSEDLRQVTASVLRNLSWRADPASKRMLREVGAVTTLVKAAMEAEKESTLKSILSALWNLSAHCSGNKADICLVDGALAFLVSTLTYNSKSKTLAIVENGGGILRNVSSHIAIQNDYRVILRKHNCLQILLQHLKSPSLTVVSNACGTLWNLSARNAVDQRALWEMGAVSMLKKLINSKHKMISMGSSAALKNLLSAKPPGVSLGLCVHSDSYKGCTDVPSLHVRKQKALSTEIDQNLAETYDNTDSPKTSPVKQGVQDKTRDRSRRHISPSARYMTAQKQRNDLMSLQNRPAGSEKLNCTYVVEEKHNGAFQVTKNAKQALNFRQGQNRFQADVKENYQLSEAYQYDADKNTSENSYELSKLNLGRSDKQGLASNEQNFTKTSKVEDATSRNASPMHSVKKENKATEHLTNVRKSRIMSREEQNQAQENIPKPAADSNSYHLKPAHESKIPLPRSMSRGDAQRSQSASPVAQRRAQSQRQHSSQIVNSRNVDITVTHPKYAWNASCEKEDNDPEQTFNMGKKLFKENNSYQASAEYGKFVEPFAAGAPQAEDYSYSSDDEVKVYNTENTPLNYSRRSSMTDLEDAVAPSRCSLNIKTNTNVKLMMKNHPLLTNTGGHRNDEDNLRLFEFRNASKDDRFFEGGKTVDFSVQSDYDFDETLSMMSRSSSVASISSFDQQSFHDDESFASDLSHRTSGIESPSELSDSPCQTVPCSPQKTQAFVKSSSFARDSSDDVQITSSASQGIEAHRGIADDEVEHTLDRLKEDLEEHRVIQNDIVRAAEREPLFIRQEAKETSSLSAENESDLSVEKLVFDDNIGTTNGTVEHFPSTKEIVATKAQIAVQNEILVSTSTVEAKDLTVTAEQGASTHRSVSPASINSVEDYSPDERLMLEKCILAGLPQGDQSQGARQKTPQLTYQLLRDTIERHPKACSYESERGMLLRNLEVKDKEYESFSENEEKGKEDERKAEKNRLFRIPESPVDKKSQDLDASKKHYFPIEKTESVIENVGSITYKKIPIDQKGNRRFEKHQNYHEKPKSANVKPQTVPEPVSQLSFLMNNKKTISFDENRISSNQISNNIEHDNKLRSEMKVDMGESVGKNKMAIISTNSSLYNQDSTSLGNESQQLIVKEPKEDTVLAKVGLLKECNEKFNKESEAVSSDIIEKNTNELFEKDIDCCEKKDAKDSEDIMLTSSILCEAKEIAEALLGARVDSTEDMTVSTLSCLSDIDNARPPSVMGDLGSLSMTNSSISEENLKAAVSRECQKILGRSYGKQISSSKKSLLRELQIGRLNSNDSSKGSNESPENLSMKSSSTSDLLGNVNPPSILDDISFTASTGSLNGIDGSDSECDPVPPVIGPYSSNQDSMSERMHDAAAMAQLYAKELSNITGNNVKDSNCIDALSKIKMPTVVQDIMEVADITEIGCDTIGSDTELEDELPCDDEETGSETLQAPNPSSLSKDDPGDGSTENLTLTLTEEQPRIDMSPYLEFKKENGCFMTSDEFRALQENADMILNTLREVEISDEDTGGISNGDMLEDETMSLVSNESDEEFLSPDGTVNQHVSKHSPRSDFILSPTYNGMVSLPQSSTNAPSRLTNRKKSLPQLSTKNKSLSNGLPQTGNQNLKNRYSYPDSCANIKQDDTAEEFTGYSESIRKLPVSQKFNQVYNNENSVSKIKAPTATTKIPANINIATNYSQVRNQDYSLETSEDGGFDSRTFTRKKSTIPKDMIPSVQPTSAQGPTMRSPSANNPPFYPGSSENISSSRSDLHKGVSSKIASVWKNSGKTRSKSAGDSNRNAKLRLEKTSSAGSNSFTSSRDDDKNSPKQVQRQSSQTPSPKSPLSRSSTFEKLNDEEGSTSPAARRPSSLALAQKTCSPRHAKGLPVPQKSYGISQKQTVESATKPRSALSRTEDPKRMPLSEATLLSPTSHSGISNIPKMQNKAQASLIPGRKSMIPTPAKFGVPEN